MSRSSSPISFDPSVAEIVPVFLALNKKREVDVFIDHYIRERGHLPTLALRSQLKSEIAIFPHLGPVVREELIAWLDFKHEVEGSFEPKVSVWV